MLLWSYRPLSSVHLCIIQHPNPVDIHASVHPLSLYDACAMKRKELTRVAIARTTKLAPSFER